MMGRGGGGGGAGGRSDAKEGRGREEVSAREKYAEHCIRKRGRGGERCSGEGLEMGRKDA